MWYTTTEDIEKAFQNKNNNAYVSSDNLGREKFVKSFWNSIVMFEPAEATSPYDLKVVTANNPEKETYVEVKVRKYNLSFFCDPSTPPMMDLGKFLKLKRIYNETKAPIYYAISTSDGYWVMINLSYRIKHNTLYKIITKTTKVSTVEDKGYADKQIVEFPLQNSIDYVYSANGKLLVTING